MTTQEAINQLQESALSMMEALNELEGAGSNAVVMRDKDDNPHSFVYCSTEPERSKALYPRIEDLEEQYDNEEI